MENGKRMHATGRTIAAALAALLCALLCFSLCACEKEKKADFYLEVEDNLGNICYIHKANAFSDTNKRYVNSHVLPSSRSRTVTLQYYYTDEPFMLTFTAKAFYLDSGKEAKDLIIQSLFESVDLHATALNADKPIVLTQSYKDQDETSLTNITFRIILYLQERLPEPEVRFSDIPRDTVNDYVINANQGDARVYLYKNHNYLSKNHPAKLLIPNEAKLYCEGNESGRRDMYEIKDCHAIFRSEDAEIFWYNEGEFVHPPENMQPCWEKGIFRVHISFTPENSIYYPQFENRMAQYFTRFFYVVIID